MEKRSPLYVLAKARTPLTSRDVAEAIGLDYRKNFNKREAKYARKLEGFIVREKLTPAPAGRNVLRWSLADQWKGQTPIQVVKAYLAARRAKTEVAHA